MSIFEAVNRAALPILPRLLSQWLPGGVCHGEEYVVKNPTRADIKPGSFSINVRTGKWADFATGDAGGDIVSLAAYLSGQSQLKAARSIARMLGIAK